MAFDYEKAFALLDNPFSPTKPIEGLKRLGAQSQLQTRPLMLNTEPCLRKLFSEQAGPFSTYLSNFKKFARREGYHDAPPRVGINSHVLSIYGYEGTGKTTLAQAMVSWLQTCKPRSGGWFVRDDWPVEKSREVAEQHTRIAAAQDYFKTTGENAYCCAVIDNLLPGALQRALDMFAEVTRDHVLFLFLLSSERELYPQLSGEGRRPMMAFRMRPLSIDEAVAFVRHRISEYRLPPPQRPSWMAETDLFPFDEADIRSAFTKGTILDRMSDLLGHTDTVALRDFSVMLNRMLSGKLESLADTFDLGQVSQEAAATHTIWLSNEYSKLVAA